VCAPWQPRPSYSAPALQQRPERDSETHTIGPRAHTMCMRIARLWAAALQQRSERDPVVYLAARAHAMCMRIARLCAAALQQRSERDSMTPPQMRVQPMCMRIARLRATCTFIAFAYRGGALAVRCPMRPRGDAVPPQLIRPALVMRTTHPAHSEPPIQLRQLHCCCSRAKSVLSCTFCAHR